MPRRVFPESLRWLVAQGRLESAHAILMKYADKSSVTVDSETLMSMLEECKAAANQVTSEVERSPLDLVRTPRLRKRTVILCYNWYGLKEAQNGCLIFLSTYCLMNQNNSYYTIFHLLLR